MDFNHSQIISYDANTNNETILHKGYEYLAGSHNLDWDGIIIEKLHTRIGAKQDIYYKNYIFVMALDDVSFNVNGEMIHTSKGDIFVSPMNSTYTIDISATFRAIMLSVSFDFIKSHFYDKNIDHIQFINNYKLVDNNLKYLIKLLLEQAKDKTSMSDVYLNQLFDTFITYYINNFTSYLNSKDEHILNQSCLTKINKYLDENFANEVTYKDINTLSGMSNYSFLNEFKTLTGSTPHQYILKRKLIKAQQLLMNSPLSITEISYDLGFTDSSHFSKFFKKQMNISPSQYRENLSLSK